MPVLLRAQAMREWGVCGRATRRRFDWLSPGLKIAELIMPDTHGSLAWTFGWFLRIAIVSNAVFYYAIFALLAHLLARRRAA